MEKERSLEAWIGKEVYVVLGRQRGRRHVKLQDVSEFGIMVQIPNTQRLVFHPWHNVAEIQQASEQQDQL